MIYRFRSKLATQDRLNAFITGIPGKTVRPYAPPQRHYEQKMECCANVTPLHGVSIYRAPDYDTSDIGISVRVLSDGDSLDMPDIWGVGNHLVCSKKFKDLIESTDDFGHQFVEINILDKDENPIQTIEPYYWFNLKRFVRVRSAEKFLLPGCLDFLPTKDEKTYLGGIAGCQASYEKLSENSKLNNSGSNLTEQ